MKTKSNNIKKGIILTGLACLAITSLLTTGCGPGKGKKSSGIAGSDAAEKAYVAPGKYDEFYAFMSGGFSGQVGVYGIPSGRLFKVIPVFSQNPENGYGYNEETKPMLQTSHGFVPWGDTHHPQLSKTGGNADGRWLFINENNTPRIAKIDLATFRTTEIIELPNSGGNHSSPFLTENTEYVVAGTRFSVPVENKDVAINTYKENFRGMISFLSVDPKDGNMSVAFQIEAPAFNWDLSRAGKGVSNGWSFFTCYNSEKENTLLEVSASQNDKDYILALNWKKAEEYLKAGKAKTVSSTYYHNKFDESKQMATSEILKDTKVLNPKDCPGMMYFMPCPKSPHGCDVDPSGEYIVGGGKLASVIPVFSYSKMIKAIDAKEFSGDIEGIPVIKYESAIAGEVQKPGLGPLHTEFDDKGFAYTSMFVSSEVVKWKLGTWEVVDRVPTYYSVGHLLVMGGDCKNPNGKYCIAMNKITKDRYLPTGPELTQSAQLYDITGNKMKMILDFPTIGEPHYAQGIAADVLLKKQKRIYKLEDNKHPYVTKNEKDARVERKGNEVHVYATSIRSHFTPDNIEGIKVGDKVYFHITNLEQDWDTPHGFAIKGSDVSELLIMPGETVTAVWYPKEVNVYPFYCTDFCSALHQEMSGYIRVGGKDSKTPLSFKTGN